jgi:chorismate synthase
MLRFLTSGESHGRALISILEGIPAGLTIDFEALTAELRRRQGGYGRGRRSWNRLPFWRKWRRPSR